MFFYLANVEYIWFDAIKNDYQAIKLASFSKLTSSIERNRDENDTVKN